MLVLVQVLCSKLFSIYTVFFEGAKLVRATRFSNRLLSNSKNKLKSESGNKKLSFEGPICNMFLYETANAYSEPCQTSKIECFVTTVNG